MKILVFLILSIFVYIMFEWAKRDYMNPLILFRQSRLAHFITGKVNLLYEKKIINLNRKHLTVIKITSISIILFVFSVILLSLYIKVLSTAIILSLPALVSPLIISKVLIEKNKQKISKQIPFYAINIKNQIKDENDIIQAIKRAKVEEPLSKYINEFLANVFNGVNVITAFNKLKVDVGVKDFTELINSFEVCYKNGGDFVKILEKYILIKTKERLQKEETEEKAFSAIITLIVMNVLNIIVIITFVLANEEYGNLVRGTTIGRAILNLNAITYMITAVIIKEVYKEE